MKRFVMVSLCALSILVFAATGYAQQLYELEKGKMVTPLYTMQPGNYQELVVGEKPPILEFKASGSIDAISEYKKNVPQGAPGAWTGQSNLFGLSPQYVNGSGLITTTGFPSAGGLTTVQKGAAFNKKESYMETRARLRFDALMGKQVSGTIFFEIDATRWGERNGAAAQRNQAGDWNADAAAVEVKNAYLTFALPPIIPVPVTVNAGILPWVTRPVTNYTDGTGINVVFKPDPAQIKLTWMKALEGQDWASDDCDVYGIEAKVNVGTLTVAGWMSYYNMNTYPLNISATSPGANAALVVTPLANNTANMSWWGLYVDGKLGPVVICTDFVYDNGKVQKHGAGFGTKAKATPGDSTVDYTGWIFRGAVDFPWERFNFGFVGMYASGSDLEKTSPNGLPGELVASGTPLTYSSKVSGYIVPPNAEHVWDDESIVFYGTGANGINRANTGYQNPGTGGGSVARGGYGGTWFAKLYANFKPTPWYRVTLLGMYIGDTTKNGNAIGNAVDDCGYPRNDKTIGWEFNLINDIQIYKNLQFRAGGGYLIAGKALDQVDLRTGHYTNTNVSPSNPWAIVTKLLYVF